SSNHIDFGFTVTELDDAPLDLPTFATLVHGQLGELANIQSTANEGDAIEVVPGVYGPACSQHETLRSDEHTYDVTVTVQSQAITFPMVMAAWRNGMSPNVVGGPNAPS